MLDSHTLFGMPTSDPWRDVCKKCLPDEKPPARNNSFETILRPLIIIFQLGTR